MTSLLTRKAVTSLLADLVAIPSTNPDLAPGEGTGEEEIARFCAAWLTDHGIEATLEEAAPGRPNVTAGLESADVPSLILCAHLDTVGTDGMSIPPFEPRIEDNRLYGRGAYDMKGGLAANMLAAAELARGDYEGGLLLALVADEEYRSVGATAWTAAHVGGACIVTEPTEGRLVLAHKGFLWATVTTRGIAAHGSRWDLGLSAIGRMGPIIAQLESHDRLELRERVHPLVGPASMHPALVEGGVGLSTYAPECTLKVERRTLPGESREAVQAELAAVIADAGEPAEMEFFFYRAPLESDPEAPVARCLRTAAASVVGSPPEEIGVGYWTDAAVFAEAGIPSVLYGPSGEGAHAAEEWVDLDSVLACARVLVEAARRFESAG